MENEGFLTTDFTEDTDKRERISTTDFTEDTDKQEQAGLFDPCPPCNPWLDVLGI
jgi:hypothetical protein